jgi:DNA-binding transcriptional MerR regulator
VEGMNIKSVARLSGLSAHTLRAWERRYGVIQPSRSDGGRRLYSMADVEKLKLLAGLVSHGHSIGTIASLSREELIRLSKETPIDKISDPQNPRTVSILNQDEIAAHHARLLKSLHLLDFEQLERNLLSARLSCPTRSFIVDLVSPLLAAVGDHVAHGKLDISQEHALSAMLRNHLGDLLNQMQSLHSVRSFTNAQEPLFLFATAEGDLHEFGILLAALLTGSRGFRFRYLGPNIPAKSLAIGAAAVGATHIVVGSVRPIPGRVAPTLSEYIQQLSMELQKNVLLQTRIWLGGYCDFDVNAGQLFGEIKYSATLQEFDLELQKLGTRSG